MRLTPAVSHDLTGHPSYGGPKHAVYAMPALRGLVLLGDFEGTVSFGLGVDHLSKVRVFELSQPSRLVIDLHH